MRPPDQALVRCFIPMRKLFCFAWLFPSLVLAATNPGRDLTIESKIEQQLAAIDPGLVEPFRQARVAIDQDDYVTAARLLAPVCDQASNFDPALRRYGSALTRIGREKEGLALIDKAVSLNRSAANLATLAGALAFPANGKPTRADQAKALAALLEARRLPDGNDPSTLAMTAQLALQLEQNSEARAASEELSRRFPDLMQTHYFAAVMAAVDEHWIRAEDEILTAKKLGLPSETVNRFLESGVHSSAVAWRYIRGTSWAVGLWAGGLIVLCGLGFLLSKLTLRQIDRANPAIAVSSGERRLRKIYRAVLNGAGIYYYISLPIVLLLVIAVAGAIIYGFLLIGRIPIKLTILLVVGAVATIWSMGRSLFLRVESRDPGRALTRDEAEALWQLTEDVARSLNTRPVDEIRLTPGTDLCVYERGTWREKMDNKAKRILVLGAAVLNDFKLDDFRSVLAHEYGHFAHRDTAGGDVAFRVRNDMLKFYYAMLKAGQATWMNVAFHFLRVYDFTFRRISHGATRLQEVLADRVAAQTYGPLAFEGGLRHVIRSSIDFDSRADREIKAALEAKRPIQNLYEASAEQSATNEEAFAKAINRPTTPDDTHPAPHERFRRISSIPEPGHTRSERVVWDLFNDRAAVVREMMETVEKNVANHRD
jgi:Zn-dependent protease with chaperone function